MQYDKPMLAEGSLSGKVVVVTGGGTGLGKSMSRYFAELGAHLVLCSRKQEVLDQAAEEIASETGAEVLAQACDIRKYDEVEALKEATLERFDKCHAEQESFDDYRCMILKAVFLILDTVGHVYVWIQEALEFCQR